MNPYDYSTTQCQNIGFDSIESAKKTLGTMSLLKSLAPAYAADNGADGTILWTEIIEIINQT